MKYLVSISFLLLGLAALSQKVVDFQMSECEHDSNPAFTHRHRLIHRALKNDTLSLQVGIVRNCSFSPSISLENREDSLILDIANLSDDYAACDCCYEINLQITEITDTNFFLAEKLISGDFIDGEFSERVVFQEFKHYQNKFIFPTLEEVAAITEFNQLTNDSLKIGLWHIDSPQNSGNYRRAFYYIDDFGKSHAKWYVDYNANNNITLVGALSGFNSEGIPNMIIIEGDFYLKLMSSE